VFVISGAFLLTGASFFNREAVAVATPMEVPEVVEPVVQVRQRLPYVKDGKTLLVPFEKVAAIHAEGHYTTAYLDQGSVFCPWSITQAEAAVPDGFMRVHRGWLVNMGLVQGFERTKDNGFCLLDPKGGLDRVPVSRAKVNAVRDALGL
ncbi:MAG: LytTR family DNA-binding domain-containing protein, partial [Paracoccaceae bacterium]